jgi:hypothetical protein
MRVILARIAMQELEDAVHFYELGYSGLAKRSAERSAYSEILQEGVLCTKTWLVSAGQSSTQSRECQRQRC